MQPQKKEWEGTTQGGRYGQGFLYWILAVVKVSFLYPILFGVIPFYLIFGRKSYKAIFSYFRRQHHLSRWKAFWSTYRNHLIFGKVVLDKFALLAGNHQQFSVDVENNDYFNALAESNKGFFIVSAHVGNFELIVHFFQQNKKKINGIIFGGESENLQKRRVKILQNFNVNLIPVSTDMSHLFAIKKAIEEGEIVSIPCDRLWGSTKKYTANFLNGEAHFPIGTFRFAAQLEAPVLTMFVMKEKGLHYRAYLKSLEPLQNEKSSQKQAEHLAKQYIALLENIVRKYPEQWFNYYDFWK